MQLTKLRPLWVLCHLAADLLVQHLDRLGFHFPLALSYGFLYGIFSAFGDEKYCVYSVLNAADERTQLDMTAEARLLYVLQNDHGYGVLCIELSGWWICGVDRC
jgi:hypothetical protein